MTSSEDDRALLDVEELNSGEELHTFEGLSGAEMTIQLERVKGKYSKAKKTSFVIMAFSAGLLVTVLLISYLTYVGALKASANATVNPYLADGIQTLSWMNKDIDKCEDFLGYATGTLRANITLTAGEKAYSLTFDTARDYIREKVRKILAGEWTYISTFYESCLTVPASLSSPTLRVAGYSSWVLRLSLINDMTNLYILVARMRWESGLEVNFPFQVSPVPNPTHPTQQMIGVYQSGFMLPSKSYYQESDVVTFYRNWIKQVFAQAGISLELNQLNDMVYLESKLAAASMDVDDANNPELSTQVISQNDLLNLMGTGMYSYFVRLNITHYGVLVNDPNFFAQLNLTGSIEPIRNLILLRLFVATFPYTDKESAAVVRQLGEFLRGTSLNSPIDWEQEHCIDLTISRLGSVISQYYILEYFDEDDRSAAHVIMDQLVDRYKLYIESWDWMDLETKQEAITKFERLVVLLGYPDEWVNYDKMFSAAKIISLGDNSLLSNILKLSLVTDHASILNLGKPVNRNAWDMDPITVNAYYDPTKNEIVIPATIQQAPFFSSKTLPYASRLAKMGSVLAHELGHVIDQSGAQYDYSGALRNWWSDAAKVKFDEIVSCIATQYSAFSVDDSHWLNGYLVAGEAMADLNGLTQAYGLLKAKMDEDDTDKEDKWVLDAYGMTQNELFFVKFAQLWTAVVSPAFEIQLSRTDPHPLARYRVLGTLRNMPEFSATFGCKSGAAYNAEVKCSMH